jgi:hypothetical protein
MNGEEEENKIRFPKIPSRPKPEEESTLVKRTGPLPPSISKPIVARPKSPRDTTKIVIDGQEVSRDEFIPILNLDSKRALEKSIEEDEKKDAQIFFQEATETDASPTIHTRPVVLSPSEPTQIIQEGKPMMLVTETSPITQFISEDSISPPVATTVVPYTSSPQPLPQPVSVQPVSVQPVPQPTFHHPVPQPVPQPTFHHPVPQPAPQPTFHHPVPQPAPQPVSRPVPVKMVQQPTTKKVVNKPAPQPKKQYSPDTMDKLKKLGYITNYQRLKDSWPEYKFPELPDDFSTDFIIDHYEHCISKIHLDNNVNQYKSILIIGFLIIEVIGAKLLGLDAGGYTASQIKAMNRYDRLLVEMGEKRMLAIGGTWPVEIRIGAVALLNFALFLLMKYLSNLLGPEVVTMISPLINSFFSGSIATSASPGAIPSASENSIPERSSNFSGLVSGIAQMASNALNTGAPATTPTPQPTGARRRRPAYTQ